MKHWHYGLLVVPLFFGCKSSGHSHGGDHGHAEHDESEGHAHLDESHDRAHHKNEHGHAGHGHGHEHPLEGETATLWTDKAELYMEWDPLVVGRESHFLAHITDMTNSMAFEAVPDGHLGLTLNVADSQIRATQEDPTSLGIFMPTITPTKAGPCTMTVKVVTKSLSETFSVASCVIHADLASARAAERTLETPGQISFLKEQQWPIEFSTSIAEKQNVVPSKTVNAKIGAVPRREARLTAGTSGRVSLPDDLPTIGGKVRKGQILARIQPTVNAPGNLGTLQSDVAAALAEHNAARSTELRIERLVATDSVPKRRLEEASAAALVTQAKLNAAKTQLASYRASASGALAPGAGGFLVKSTIAGTLVERSVTHGETAMAGAPLFTVIDLDRVRVEGRVFEPDISAFEQTTSAWFTVAGRQAVFEITEATGSLISLGHILDPRSRTVPVIFEVDNPQRVLRIGQYAKLSVGTGTAAHLLVIPESAVLQDGNQQIAFVHASGESFQRRVLALGTRSRGVVEVRRGVVEGERVVSVGAYDVKLAASAGGAPAHGHAH